MSNMKQDHRYAEMLGMMRKMGGKDNPLTLQIGVMLSANSVKIDDLTLNAEDLYIADYLIAGYSRKLQIPYIGSNSTTQENTVYTEGLKKGDLVAVQKLHESNRYVILAKVVSAK